VEAALPALLVVEAPIRSAAHRAPHRPLAVPPAVVVLPGSLPALRSGSPAVRGCPPAPGCRIASAGWCPV